MKYIQIDPHTKERMKKRGATEEEVIDVIKTGIECEVHYGRKGKFKVYPYQKLWEGKYYQEKKVEVIYCEELDKIVTVTVYVYYGRWLK